MKKTKTVVSDIKMLTEVELELMNILWKLREGAVADVMAALPAERELAYTSVSTILRILEQKEILKIRKEGRGHIYIPNIPKSEYELRAVRDVVDKVFDGAPANLVKQLIESGTFDEQSLQDLKTWIDQAGAKK